MRDMLDQANTWTVDFWCLGEAFWSEAQGSIRQLHVMGHKKFRFLNAIPSLASANPAWPSIASINMQRSLRISNIGCPGMCLETAPPFVRMSSGLRPGSPRAPPWILKGSCLHISRWTTRSRNLRMLRHPVSNRVPQVAAGRGWLLRCGCARTSRTPVLSQPLLVWTSKKRGTSMLASFKSGTGGGCGGP